MSVTQSDSASLYNKPGLPLIIVDNDHCRAVIALQGAQLLEFKLKSMDGNTPTPLLWLSPAAVFAPGKAIRGGIPLCFPWFGPHVTDRSLPQHGFARISKWLLTSSNETVDTTTLTFTFNSTEQTLRTYPHAFTTELTFKLGKTLEIEFTVTNQSATTMPVSWALHSYFPVSDTEKTSVPELMDFEYVDQIDASRSKHLLSKLDFSQHIDAVFQCSPEQITLLRPEGSLIIHNINAPTTVVWNPNSLANNMADLGPETYRQFVCVERGAALEDGWSLAAGESRRAAMTISDRDNV